MRKLLMISAILVMGTLGYGGQEATLVGGKAETTLGLTTKGNVKSIANKAQLLITPLNGTGNTTNQLMFNFNSIALNGESTLRGEFKAEVLKEDGGTIKYGELKEGTQGNIKVGLIDRTTTTSDPIKVNELKTTVTKTLKDKITNTKDLGNITYTLSNKSGVKDSGRSYIGEIVSTVKATGTNTGSFNDNGVLIVVDVNGVELK